MKHISCICD